LARLLIFIANKERSPTDEQVCDGNNG